MLWYIGLFKIVLTIFFNRNQVSSLFIPPCTGLFKSMHGFLNISKKMIQLISHKKSYIFSLDLIFQIEEWGSESKSKF